MNSILSTSAEKTTPTKTDTPMNPQQRIDPKQQTPSEQPAGDERMKRVSLITALIRRPELGAITGLILVTIFFLIFADSAMFTLSGIMNFMVPASQLGILAIGAALLMIEGEFDLSLGSMIAFAGLIFGTALMVLHLPLSLALIVTFACAIAFRTLNAQIVFRTGLPSFIVTLAFLFVLRGLTLVGLKMASGGSTQLRGFREAAGDSFLVHIFSGNAFTGLFRWAADHGWIDKFPNGAPTVTGVPVEILWFIGLTIVATWVLLRTRFGNWIFAAGGDPKAARNSGVPVNKVKTILFIFVAVCATLVAVLIRDGCRLNRCQTGLPKRI
ncbi:ABC transporter permease [Vibrio sp. PP-XX7]